ncbi:copper amine oxidase N-terminal domain-containing protein [Desulforamulus ruminis]|uniref:Copper amine oxidase-like domain-containing protein n=1 Tax=Desulforamulus ruminis (strain ATCC 23193 / DSM 2154 / NCIMB 8452 / DL) TaxID=696281 RepID=F6DKM2_DESRL|nr:copper amine oxidase N-terminal domain-containing protein [Desulforamulus ruminis]AEG60397.1 copper amine oxidase-like domain-containing protein [Desulforamulus ruminis DSM 2154]
MKRFAGIIFLVMFFNVWPGVSFADTPVTSTPFANAYKDRQIVEEAMTWGVPTEEITRFLQDPKQSLDIKAAVINAMYQQQTWEVRNHAELYAEQRYDKPVADLDLKDLNGDELFCLGYLILLDDYLTPQKAIPYLEEAKIKNPQSFTVSMILALAKAQSSMRTNDGNNLWDLTEPVFTDSFLTQDMKKEAVQIIKDYMILYKVDSAGPAEEAVPDKVEKPVATSAGELAINVYMNGSRIIYDEPPLYDPQTNRTLVPFRKTFEALGAEVWLDEAGSSVFGKRDEVVIQLPVGQAKALVNEQEITLDVPTKIINNRTMVPLRFVGQAFGYEVTAQGEPAKLDVFIKTVNPTICSQ